MRFDFFIDFTIKNNEGGYSDLKSDKGGATNLGVSIRFLRNAGIDKNDLDSDGNLKELIGDLNNDGLVDGRDIKLINFTFAKKLYKRFFWNDLYEEIPLANLAFKVFDLGINMGVPRAVKLLQETLRTHHSKFNVKTNGVFGTGTLIATKQVDNNLLLKNYKEMVSRFYHSRCEEDPSQKIYLKGWINRLNRDFV